MSQIEINICREIIAEDFGPVVEKIIAKLIPKGRQTLSQLIKETNEDSKTTRDCLVILIQHNLVTFANTIERGRSFTFYEANIENILLRLRFPQYIYLTRTELGQSASLIVKTLLEYGRLQASDIKEFTKMSEENINSILEQLLKKSFLIPVTQHDQNTKADIYIQDEAEEVAKSQVPLTGTELKKLKARMNAERNAEIAQGPTGKKRKINTTFEEAEKRMRLEEGKFDFLSSSDCYKVNFEQYHIYFRNQDIEEFATSHLNQSAGDVARVFINQVREKMKITKETRSGLAISTENLFLNVTKPVPNTLDEYMQAMSQDHLPIFDKVEAMGGGKYVLDLHKWTQKMRIEIIENLVREKVGEVAVRIWRLLADKKMLDDKQVSKLALVDEKVTRGHLYSMLKAGLVLIQDVPRTIDHSASRTIFLWYVDYKKSCKLLLQNCYKTIFRLKCRQKFETQARKLLLQKASRSDIKTGEAKLSDGEISKLEELGNILKKLQIQVSRIDWMIMRLRDF